MKPTADELKDKPEEVEIRDELFVCYECRGGSCERCIGIPCMCDCPIPEPPAEEPEYSI